jgi:hypothetical protein
LHFVKNVVTISDLASAGMVRLVEGVAPSLQQHTFDGKRYAVNRGYTGHFQYFPAKSMFAPGVGYRDKNFPLAVAGGA